MQPPQLAAPHVHVQVIAGTSRLLLHASSHERRPAGHSAITHAWRPMLAACVRARVHARCVQLRRLNRVALAGAPLLQNVLDGWAATGERLQALLTWQDPVASALFTVLLGVLAVGLLVLGLRTLVIVGLLWVVRPPALRDPLPPPPANFIARLPTRGDVSL